MLGAGEPTSSRHRLGAQRLEDVLEERRGAMENGPQADQDHGAVRQLVEPTPREMDTAGSSVPLTNLLT